MEKIGVIRPGVTPPENGDQSGKIEEKAAAVTDLDNDFRKRAAQIAANFYRERADSIKAAKEIK
jgi:hypothetical protein